MEKINMKIELSPVKIVPGAITVWSEQSPEVDIVMDLKNLTFKPGSVDEIYSFHVLDHLFIDEGVAAVSNWKKCLKPEAKLFIIVDDFEYVARAFVGGDISIELFNDLHSHPSQYTRENLLSLIKKCGYSENKTNIWFQDVTGLFKKKHYELVFDTHYE